MAQHGGRGGGRMLLQAKCRLHNRTGLNLEFEIVLFLRVGDRGWGGVKQRDATIANEKVQSFALEAPLLRKWELPMFLVGCCKHGANCAFSCNSIFWGEN